ncbi:MAG: response regulator, partial [Saprospiraceae bacterium]|nr:response regulator [Saprospiraceae bacterium]
KRDNEKLTDLNQTIQNQNAEIARKNIEVNMANQQLNEKNNKLDDLNDRLVDEISARENSQQTLFSKDHHLASAATRMREPISNIVTATQSLIAENPRGDQRDTLYDLQFSTNKLLVLINDILDFSEIGAAKIAFERVDFHPSDVVIDLQKALNQTKVPSFFYADPLIPEQLNGDPVRLTQILSYFLRNLSRVVEYDQNSKIEVRLRCSDIVNDELSLRLDISTTCAETHFKTLERFFCKPLSRADVENFAENEVELIVTRRLVELQNGTIQVNQALENELHLCIALPFKRVLSGEHGSDTEGVIPSFNNNFLEGKRLLVVEDNKVNQMLVVNMLKKKGIQVLAANDGIEALEAIDNQDFDLILMDIQMPRMDGYRAVAEIRRLKNAQKANVPIIALTASAFVTEKEKAELFGMTDHIGKPFSPEELMEKIARILLIKSNNQKPMLEMSV